MATTTQPQSMRTTVKVTAVGDVADAVDTTGVSALLGLENKVTQMEVAYSAQTHSVELRDTGDMAELDRLQPAVYKATNCFLLCYSERDRATYDVIETKWYPEVSSICPGVPYLLVACRRPGDEAASKVTVAEGQKLSAKIKAAGFVEYQGGGDVLELLREALKAVAENTQAPPEAVRSTPGHVESDGGGGGGVGCCSCFKRCFKSKDSSYSFQ